MNTKSNNSKNLIYATGHWHSKRDCEAESNPKRSARYGAPHRFEDIARRPSGEPGESLVTSKCRYCGGLIVDCPTIGLAEFAL